LKGHVSSKYPLVAATTLQASEAAIDRLQVMLPGLLPRGTAAVGELAGIPGVERDAIAREMTTYPSRPQ
jgi:hypothetical protein